MRGPAGPSTALALEAVLGPLPGSPQELLAFVEDLLLDHGYLVVFLGTSLDFCLPSSGDTVMLAGGWFSNAGPLSLGTVMLFGALGGFVSDNTMYWTGRLGGRPLVERVLRLGFLARLAPSRRLDRVEKYFEAHGGKTVIVGRVIPGLRAALPLSAGLSRMSYPRFLAVDVLAIALWATLVGSVGHLFGEYWEEIITVVRSSGWALVVVLAVLVVLLAYGRYRDRRSR